MAIGIDTELVYKYSYIYSYINSAHFYGESANNS